MTERARREYAAVMQARYQRATKAERGRLLDEYCRTTGCHRKAAIRRLRRAPGPPTRPPGRPARYVPQELAPLLEQAWLASDQLSGKLLRPILPMLLTALARHGWAPIAPEVRAALTRASAATLDRLLRPLRRRRPRQPRRLAPALASLRTQVPLRTWSEWTGVRPGALPCGRGRYKGIWYCTVASPRRAATAPRSSRWTSRRAGRSCTRSMTSTSSGSPGPSSISRRACRSRCTPGTATMAASLSMRVCSAGASAARSGSPAGGPIARTIKPGSSSATACSCAGSSAMTATARARRGRCSSACIRCCGCSITSSGPCGSS